MAQPTRILCLHGFCSTASHLEGGLKALQKRMAKASPPIELHFLQAPLALPIPEDTRQKAAASGRSLEDFQRYSWWDASDDGKEYRGWKESVAYVQDHMKKSGPFHGILGFSQGAVMASVMCASSPIESDLRFALLIGGFPPRDTELQKLMKESPALQKLNSLHIIGEGDDLVKPEWSKKLTEMFHSPSVLLHPGGHYIPTSRSYCDQIIDFVEQNESSKL
ncbi:hypothetical protein ACHAXT_010327 [Thalassiosira profunda]